MWKTILEIGRVYLFVVFVKQKLLSESTVMALNCH